VGPSTERLGLSADATQKRIQVARTSRRFPQLLECLASGRIHLSGLNLLSPHLTEDNVEKLLDRAEGKSKREIEALVAELAPRPDVTGGIRKLPGPRSVPRAKNSNEAVWSEDAAPATACEEVAGDLFSSPEPSEEEAEVARPVGPSRTARPSITPLAPARYKVQFTAGLGPTHSRVKHTPQPPC
jgi:hypothetical protein